MKEENIEAVEKFLNALKQRDLSLAPLADNLKFKDPLTGEDVGAENLKAFLAGFLPALNDVRIVQHVCEGEYVVTLWEADGIFGVIPILEKFRVRDGLIIEADGYFDPKPILGS